MEDTFEKVLLDTLKRGEDPSGLPYQKVKEELVEKTNASPQLAEQVIQRGPHSSPSRDPPRHRRRRRQEEGSTPREGLLLPPGHGPSVSPYSLPLPRFPGSPAPV